MRPERVRRAAMILLAPIAVLLLPLPWRTVTPSLAPGTAWRLDGRLELGGTQLDPPGETIWLAAGRPQLIVERLIERSGGPSRSAPIVGSTAPAASVTAVPAAVAATRAAAGLTGPPDGADARFALRVGPIDLGPAASRLGLGDSHGLAVAVGMLRASGDLDLGGARVAATGRIDADGAVGPVGGIAPKARAAARAGVALLLVPASQTAEAQAALDANSGGGDAVPKVVGVADLRQLLGFEDLEASS